MDSESQQILRGAAEAVETSNWRVLAVLAVMAIVYAARLWGAKRWPLLGEEKAIVGMSVVIGVLGAAANNLLAGEGFSLSDAVVGITNGLTAAGTWVALRRTA